jgi:hypothetical protein
MLTIAILFAAAGAVLGSQFKIFILAPALFFALFSTAAAGLVHGFRCHDIALAMLAILASLEFGYFAGGVGTSYLSVQPKSQRRSWTPSQY